MQQRRRLRPLHWLLRLSPGLRRPCLPTPGLCRSGHLLIQHQQLHCGHIRCWLALLPLRLPGRVRSQPCSPLCRLFRAQQKQPWELHVQCLCRQQQLSSGQRCLSPTPLCGLAGTDCSLQRTWLMPHDGRGGCGLERPELGPTASGV
jgi:hypothetical protein